MNYRTHGSEIAGGVLAVFRPQAGLASWPLCWIWVGLLLGMSLCTVQAVPKTTTWNGNGENWTNELSWSAGIPADGDDVIINGNVVLTNSTPFLNSYTNNAGMTHTFGGTNTILYATNVTISGTITHYANTATATNALGVWVPDNRIYIVCSNLTVAGGGKIDALGKGYGSSPTPGPGYGPGGGALQAGGSYGGAGNFSAGNTYGSASAPEDPGSGGGGRALVGVAGGGAIRINAAGTVLVNGTINADGANNPDADAGSGSGGSVFITCRVFDGTNAVSAKGGDSSQGAVGWRGGGGGGRIAIVYDTNAQVSIPAVNVSAAMGIDGATYGYIGSLYFPNNLFLTETISYFGQWMVPNFTNWAPNNLTVSNGWILFPADGFQLSVTNRITVRGTDVKKHKLEFSRAVVTCGENIVLTNAQLILYRSASAGPTVSCGGNLSLAGGAQLSVYAVGTNLVPLPGYGALVDVTGDVSVASSWIYPYSHPTNGGSVLFRMRNLLITGGANGGFDANSKGFRAATNGYGSGFGPGGGPGVYSAAGYGGRGGYHQGVCGPTYGSAAAPIEPGSGGASVNGTMGGGAVRIEARGAVTHSGTITAQGGNISSGGGGGSGGGVYILCGSFAGTGGVIQADGGNQSNDGGGGGGGRIAVLYTNTAAQNLLPIPDVRFSAAGGAQVNNDGYTTRGDAGTLYFPDNRFLLETFRHSGQWMGQPTMTSWAPNNLVVSNGWLKFSTDGFKLTVTNNVTVLGINPYAYRLELTNGLFTCGGNISMSNASLVLYAGITSGPTLTCGGNFDMTIGAKFSMYSGPTNSVSTNYGALVTVAGDLTITNAWIYPFSHLTNGGSVLFRMRNLTIFGINGGFDATGNGYQAGLGPGPGATGPASGGGGGYGGIGGASQGGLTPGGQTYGSSNAPVDAGSGGGTINGYPLTTWGGSGGGAIRLQVTQTFLHNGSILANGQNKASTWGAAGAGGSVYIYCKRFAGSVGVIYANGGQGNNTAGYGGGGGGGGRIAIWSVRDAFTGTLTVPTGGTTAMDASYWGKPGTLVRGRLPAPGTMISVY